jgi:predicted metalloprotease with PDZ domain
MPHSRSLAFVLLAAPALLYAQAPLHYTLRVDSADLSSIQVEMRIPAVPDTLRLAMATHDEYAEKFWRNVRDLHAVSRGAPLAVTREDSAVWRIAAARGDSVTVRYRIALPVDTTGRPRASWRPFLSPTGGLVGGIDCFMFLPGRADLPAQVELQLPRGWRAATGLAATADSNVFQAKDARALLDSPILVGSFRSWTFTVDSTPHRVVLWSGPGAAAFDSAAFVSVVQRIVTQSLAIFGRPPYHDYAFLFQDAAFGALEHLNSVTIGVSTAELARDPAAYYRETAHEFFHTWNLMRVRPAPRGELRTGVTPPTNQLWWSEGATIFFAGEIEQRAGLLPRNESRADRLARDIARYLANPGYQHVAPERASATSDLPPGANGDYGADYYLSGQLLAEVLGLIIRDSTGGRRGADDLMRAMYAQYGTGRAFTGPDLERAANATCGCDLDPFFDRYVRGAAALDFDGALRAIGYRMKVAWEMAADSAGHALPDTRIFAVRPAGSSPDAPLILGVTRPTGVWAFNGVHAGDELIALDGRPIASSSDFRRALADIKVGDRVTITFAHAGRRKETSFLMDVYVLPRVTLEELPGATPAQLALRARWLAGE